MLQDMWDLNSLTRDLTREGNGTPLQFSCLENPMDRGAWWATVHGVTKSQTQLSNFTFTFHSHALEKEMATHSRVLAWRIPGTGEPGGLPSMGSHRVGHDWRDLGAAAVAWKIPLEPLIFLKSLSHSIVSLCFFPLITKEGFLISPCYSLELCIQMGISFLFSLAFCFSFLNYSQGLLRKSFCLFAFLLLGDGFDHLLLYNVTNLCPLFFGHSIRSNPLTICHSHCMIIRDSIVPKWSSDFPYFFQFKSEFCNK